jgi:hypothetical protein
MPIKFLIELGWGLGNILFIFPLAFLKQDKHKLNFPEYHPSSFDTRISLFFCTQQSKYRASVGNVLEH